VPLEHAPVGVESGNLDLATEVDAYFTTGGLVEDTRLTTTCCTRTLFGRDCMGLVRSWFGPPLRFLIT
jgi:hypothetical protein